MELLKSKAWDPDASILAQININNSNTKHTHTQPFVNRVAVEIEQEKMCFFHGCVMDLGLLEGVSFDKPTLKMGAPAPSHGRWPSKGP